MVAKSSKTSDLDRRRRRLRLPVAALLLVATAANGYLAHLYYRAKAAPSHAVVDSFCNISDRWDCVSVARSVYAEFLGIPVAVYGAEFFGLALAVTLLAGGGRIKLRAWDSVVFVMMLCAAPISLFMAWIAFFKIRTLCLLCTTIYGANGVTLLLLGVAHGRRLRELAGEGLRELRRRLKSNAAQATLLALVVIAVSQFFWLPRLTPTSEEGPKLSGDPWQGIPQDGLVAGAPRAKARVEIFTDFQCPFCAQLHHLTQQVLKKHPDELQLVHRDFPLDQSCNRVVRRPFHDRSCAAAIFGRCAAEQGRFWHFSSLLFAHQHDLGPPELERLARTAGLDVDKLRACAGRPAVRAAVQQDIEEGIRRGVNGTPTCFIGGKQVPHQQVVQPEFWKQLVGAQ